MTRLITAAAVALTLLCGCYQRICVDDGVVRSFRYRIGNEYVLTGSNVSGSNGVCVVTLTFVKRTENDVREH